MDIVNVIEFLNHPALAIEQVKRAICSMAALACDSIREAMQLFGAFSEAGFKRVCDLEEIIDTYLCLLFRKGKSQYAPAG